MMSHRISCVASRKRRGLLACAAMILSVTGGVTHADTEQDRAQVQHALQRYVESVDAADVNLASRVWLQSPDVAAVTPAGEFVGWDSVRQNLYVNFLQGKFLEREFQPANVQVHVHDNTAWVVFDWSFKAKQRNGQPFTSAGRETDVFYKIGHGWRLVHIHYSEKVTQS